MAADKPVIVDIDTDPRRFVKKVISGKENTEAVIESKPNGPYLVKNLENLKNSRDERIETQPNMILCRCGGSGNKPFCDGSHTKIGFRSDKGADRVLPLNNFSTVVFRASSPAATIFPCLSTSSN